MKPGEKGFTLVELLLVVAITAITSVAAGAAIFQVFKGTEHNNDRITAVRQVQNAGYWISRDAQMAQSVTTSNLTDNLTPLDFLTLNWTEYDAAGAPIYHSANYTFDNLTDGIGTLKRIHESAGASEATLIAQYIYYDLKDVDDTSKAIYQRPVLTVQLTAVSGKTRETREYKIKRRPNL